MPIFADAWIYVWIGVVTIDAQAIWTHAIAVSITVSALDSGRKAAVRLTIFTALAVVIGDTVHIDAAFFNTEANGAFAITLALAVFLRAAGEGSAIAHLPSWACRVTGLHIRYAGTISANVASGTGGHRATTWRNASVRKNHRG